MYELMRTIFAGVVAQWLLFSDCGGQFSSFESPDEGKEYKISNNYHRTEYLDLNFLLNKYLFISFNDSTLMTIQR